MVGEVDTKSEFVVIAFGNVDKEIISVIRFIEIHFFYFIEFDVEILFEFAGFVLPAYVKFQFFDANKSFMDDDFGFVWRKNIHIAFVLVGKDKCKAYKAFIKLVLKIIMGTVLYNEHGSRISRGCLLSKLLVDKTYSIANDGKTLFA